MKLSGRVLYGVLGCAFLRFSPVRVDYSSRNASIRNVFINDRFHMYFSKLKR